MFFLNLFVTILIILMICNTIHFMFIISGFYTWIYKRYMKIVWVESSREENVAFKTELPYVLFQIEFLGVTQAYSGFEASASLWRTVYEDPEKNKNRKEIPWYLWNVYYEKVQDFMKNTPYQELELENEDGSIQKVKFFSNEPIDK